MTIDWTQVAPHGHLDSRDLIEARENARDDLTNGCDMADEAIALIEAIDELEGCGIEDWEHGAHFIREDCFVDYAQELAEDIGVMPDPSGQWPLYCIDWQRAARELAQDFTTVEFIGSTYYVR